MANSKDNTNAPSINFYGGINRNTVYAGGSGGMIINNAESSATGRPGVGYGRQGDENDDDYERIEDKWDINFEDPAILKRVSDENNNYQQMFETVVEALGEEQDFLYMMTTGLVLIINNEDFLYKEKRTGTNKDVAELVNLFKYFPGWDVLVKENRKRGQIEELFRDIAERKTFPYKVLFMIVLSHGNKKGILGTDSNKGAIDINSLTRLFKSNNAPAFKGIPKFFIIQACRGDRDDTVKTDGDSSTDADRITPSIPELTDLLIAYPCMPGYVALRNEDTGSWFIQWFVRWIRNKYAEDDIETILKRVNNSVAKVFCESGLKEQPCYEVALRHKCYFKDYFVTLEHQYREYNNLLSRTESINTASISQPRTTPGFQQEFSRGQSEYSGLANSSQTNEFLLNHYNEHSLTK